MGAEAAQGMGVRVERSAAVNAEAGTEFAGDVDTNSRGEHSDHTVARRAEPSAAKDVMALAKPGITLMCVLMSAGGIALAEHSLSLMRVLAILAASALCVAAANALNMYLERDSDRFMARTRNRPLPAGRMEARTVLIGGCVAGMISVVLLWVTANALTAAVGAAALLSYVLLYTPLKRRSSAALIVGAFPGAAPPLLGWTAATGRIDAVGAMLFLILLLWQIPHFIAIAIYRKAEYERAGIKVLTAVRGEDNAKLQAVAYSAALVVASLFLVPLRVAGYGYFVIASALGAAFFVFCLWGFERNSGKVWARQFFLSTLVYLPALVGALVLDVALLQRL